MSLDEEDHTKAFAKLRSLYGVTAYVVLNQQGVPINQSVGMTEARAIKISGLVSELTRSTREFLNKRYSGVIGNHSDGKEQPKLAVMRLRMKKNNELIICPDELYTLVVLHDPDQSTALETQPEKDEKGSEEDSKQ